MCLFHSLSQSTIKIKEKRYDIQGIRAWSVIAVVLFHFFPSTLPFGYLGVDVFFVLSGFLISLVLENKPELAISTYTDFYFKRIRRIFPLLILTVLICSIAAATCYSELIFLYSKRSALYAVFFATNLRGKNDGEDYFNKMEKTDDLYTHTWSLSVEIQFYLMAPVVLKIFMPPRSKPFHTFGYFLVISVCSFIYSKSLEPTLAFYSTIGRLWQFLAGAIAFRLQGDAKSQFWKDDHSKNTSSRLNVIAATISVAVILLNIFFYNWESAFRCAVTFFAAALLVLNLSTPILTHPWLLNIGDSSYSLYLIHWPILCAMNFFEFDHWAIRLLGMLAVFAASFFVYENFEKWYLTLTEKATCILIAKLYVTLAILFVGHSLTRVTNPDIEDIHRPRTFDEAYVINQYMDTHWEEYLEMKDCTLRDPLIDVNPYAFCYMPKGNGNLTFLIIGNSYAANHGRMIIDNFKDHYGNIAVHSVDECEPLIETRNEYCTEALKKQEEFLNDLDTYKPDILFMSARYIEPNVPIETENVQDDPLFLSMMEKLRKYEEKVKKVFILQAFPRPANIDKVEKARIKAGKSIDGYMEEAIEADAIPMRKRVEEIAKHCKKCVVYDLMPLHMVNGSFMVSNPISHLHYFELVRHHTVVGLKLVEPLYRRLSQNFADLMTAKWPQNVVT